MQIRCYNCFQEYENAVPQCPHCGHKPDEVKRVPNHLAPGTVLNGRYIIGEVLGVGGFGITYKAWDNHLESIVAIKEFFPNGLVNRTPGTERLILFSGNKQKMFNYNLAHFIDEARYVAKFGAHPNIVNVFEYFEANRTAYMVMEFMDGLPLDKYMKTLESRNLDCDTAVEIAESICKALRTVHGEKLVHRDIAPDNIFLLNGGGIKLYDFGAARLSKEDTPEDAALKTVIVKPGYAPQEQYQSTSPQGPYTDIYALGATLYHMVTGVKPYESTDRTESNDPVLDPDQLESGIPKYINDSIMKAMAIEPHMRFRSVDEFEEALTEKRRVLPLHKERKRRRRRRAFGLGASLLAVAAGCGLFVWSLQQQRAEKTLPEATLEIWYNGSDKGTAEALMAVRDEFCENYDTVTIELVEVTPSEFQTKLDAAIAEGSMPALFQSDSVTFDVSAVTSLKDVVSALDLSQYWLLEDYAAVYPDYDRLPMGFNMPVVYTNTIVSSFESSSVTNVSEITGAGGSITVAPVMQETYVSLFGEDAFAGAVGMDQFYSGSAGAMFSDTSMYYSVSAALPARYHMAAIGLERVPCTFDNCWSMGAGLSRNEEKAAERFLEFLLSDNSQDYFYIRNQYEALPLNKNALSVYEDVYAEFAPLFENMTVYTAGE